MGQTNGRTPDSYIYPFR